MLNSSKIEGKKASRRHIIIFDEDHEFIQTFYGDSIGYSAAIRRIIHEHVKTLKRKAMEKAAAKLSLQSPETSVVFDDENSITQSQTEKE